MTLHEAIHHRHAYRKLKHAIIDHDLLKQLTAAAKLAPSCYNNQPWRFVMVTDPDLLEQLHSAYSKGNEWARKASLVVAVATETSFDCVIGDREYALFDTGIATGFMLLAATEAGLVAHPIAGYDPPKVKEILGIPKEWNVITLVVMGEHDRTAAEGDEEELTRPPRKPDREFAWIDRYGG
jgi:nitroreductase